MAKSEVLDQNSEICLQVKYDWALRQFCDSTENLKNALNPRGIRYDRVRSDWKKLSADERMNVLYDEFYPILDELEDKLGIIQPWHDGWIGCHEEK